MTVIIIRTRKSQKNLKVLLSATDSSSYILQMSQAPHMDDIPLEIEMRLRLFLRSLLWELIGDDYGHRAVKFN